MVAEGASRYAGLVYTSTERGAGGWQITSRTGDLSAAEEAELKSFVVTTFDAHGGPLPMYVDAEQIRSMPIRFGAAPSAGGGVVLWQASQAGTDSTGRPGNVFSQVVLDRVGDGRPQAIAFWRSPSFVLPYGPVEVRDAAERPPVEPQESVVTTTSAVIASILDYATYLRLAVLLDAVTAARASGAPVVLRGSDQDEAARLVAAMCALTIPAWSHDLRFSLYERSKAITTQTARRWDLAVVPDEDDPVDAGVVSAVIGLEEEPQPGEGTQPHVTEHGDEVGVTEWSELLQYLSLMPEDEIDAVLGTLAGWTDEVQGAPGWWLALAIAWTPAVRASDEVDEPGPREAALQVLRNTPAPLLADERAKVLEEALSPVPSLRQLGEQLSSMTDADGRYVVRAEQFIAGAVRDLATLPSELPVLRRGIAARTIGNPWMIGEAIADLGDSGNVTAKTMHGLLSVLEVGGWLLQDDRGSRPIHEGLLAVLAQLLDKGDVLAVTENARRLPTALQTLAMTMFAEQSTHEAQGKFLATRPMDLVMRVSDIDVERLRRSAHALGGPIGRIRASQTLALSDDPNLAVQLMRSIPATEPLRSSVSSGTGRLGQAEWTRSNRVAAALVRPGLLSELELVELVLSASREHWAELDEAVRSIKGADLLAAASVRRRADGVARAGKWTFLKGDFEGDKLHAEAARLRRIPNRTADGALMIDARSIWFVVAIEDLMYALLKNPFRASPESVLLLGADAIRIQLAPLSITELLVPLLAYESKALRNAMVLGAAWKERASAAAKHGGVDGAAVLAQAIVRAVPLAGRGSTVRQDAEDLFEATYATGPLGRLPVRRKPVDSYMKWAMHDAPSERLSF